MTISIVADKRFNKIQHLIIIKGTKQNRNKDNFLILTKGIYEKSIPDIKSNDKILL